MIWVFRRNGFGSYPLSAWFTSTVVGVVIDKCKRRLYETEMRTGDGIAVCSHRVAVCKFLIFFTYIEKS